MSSNPYDLKINFDAINEYLTDQETDNRSKVKKQFIEEAKMRMKLQDGKGIMFNDLLLQIPVFSSFEGDQCLIFADFLEQRLFRKRLKHRLQRQHALEILWGFVCRWRYVQCKRGHILKEEFLLNLQELPT